jgi:hypothetical protein
MVDPHGFVLYAPKTSLQIGVHLMRRDLAELKTKTGNRGLAGAGRALLLLTIVLATAATACTPVAPSGPFTVPEAPCADVVLITARGSSQDVASWEAASIERKFRQQLASIAPGRSLRILELGDLNGDAVLDPGGYPAFGFDQIVGLDTRAASPEDLAIVGGYNESRRVGAAEAVAVLEQIAASCPSSRLAVVGTSMGADSIALGLRQVSQATEERIDTLHLFGDPRFTRGPWARALRVQVPSGHGLLGPRLPYVPAGLVSRTVSWCGEFDGTCSGVWPLSIFQAIADCSELRQFAWCSRRHIDYDYWAHEPAMREAAAEVARRAGWANEG